MKVVRKTFAIGLSVSFSGLRVSVTDIHGLGDVEVPPEESRESFLELLVGERVAKRIDGTVRVAQEVREHVQMFVNARRVGAETLHQRQYVIWSPTNDERA